MTYEEKDRFISKLKTKAGDYEEIYINCAQGTLLALQEAFELGDRQTLKAATAMPGIALRGETCGAVIGAIMALGLVFGREKPEDFGSFVHTTRAAQKLCRLFEEQLGSCLCRDVQKCLLGRSYDLTDPEELAAFIEAGAAKVCRKPAETAAGIAGEIILKFQNK